MVTKMKTTSQSGFVDLDAVLSALSERIAEDIYYTIILSKGVAEIKSGKGLSGKEIDKFFESMLS